MKTKNKTLGMTLLLGLCGALCMSGCELINALQDPDEDTVVNVFSTHHATPQNGVVPDRGGQGQDRVFETDQGWTATLAEGYVVTRSVTMHSCDGVDYEVEFFSGAITEDLKAADLGLTTLGGLEVGDVAFCAMSVTYAPFYATTDIGPAGADEEDLDGATVLLRGFAQKDDQMVSFEIRVEETITVDLDLVELTGGPVEVRGTERFPLELTLSKTYDRFFDGVDLSDTEGFDMGTQARAVLELETSVATGTIIGG